MRKIGLLALGCVLFGICLAVPRMANAEEPKVLKYHLISEVWIYEPRVTAIAIEFDKDLTCAFDLTGYFSVNAELKELKSHEGIALPATSWPKGPRTILHSYTSNVPEIGVVNQGRFVILELNPLDSNATSIYMNLKRFDLDKDKKLGYNNGREILPYDDKMVYEIKQLNQLKYADGAFTGTGFAFERASHRVLTAEKFVPGLYTSPNTSVTLKVNNEEKKINSIGYTLYSPPNPEPGKKYPFVLYLHGSSCRSIYEDGVDDRMTPVYTNQGSVTWVENGTPDCYVFVPQYENDTVVLVKEAFKKMMDDSSLAIDENRIYISGLSMGGASTWSFLTDDALGHYFAAALICCGFPYEDVTKRSYEVPDTMAAKIKAVADRGVQVWMHHADIDPTVPVKGSRMAFNALQGIPVDTPLPEPFLVTDEFSYYGARGGQVQYSEIHFVPNQRNVNLNMFSVSPHEVYENTYSTPDYIQWLFMQSK